MLKGIIVGDLIDENVSVLRDETMKYNQVAFTDGPMEDRPVVGKKLSLCANRPELTFHGHVDTLRHKSNGGECTWQSLRY